MWIYNSDDHSEMRGNRKIIATCVVNWKRNQRFRSWFDYRLSHRCCFWLILPSSLLYLSTIRIKKNSAHCKKLITPQTYTTIKTPIGERWAGLPWAKGGRVVPYKTGSETRHYTKDPTITHWCPLPPTPPPFPHRLPTSHALRSCLPTGHLSRPSCPDTTPAPYLTRE